MINPIKIKIKGYPKDKDSFYNENDLMQTIKIVITDFPYIMSIITDYTIAQFYAYANSKTNLLQSELNPLVNDLQFNSSIKGSKLFLKGNMKSKIELSVNVTSSVLLKGKTQEAKSISFYIIPDKCYVMGSKSKIGDWDNSTLNSMDNLSLSVLSGIVG